MKKILFFWFPAIFLAAGCGGVPEEEKAPPAGADTALTGKLTICGADALQPLMLIWANEFGKLHPGLELDVTGGGTGKGLALLREGKVDAAMVSRRLSPGEETRGMVAFPVSREAVVPVVSHRNPHRDLLLTRGVDRAGLSAVYSEGQEVSWGWLLDDTSPLPVKPYKRTDLSGAEEVWAGYLGIFYPKLAGTGVTGDEGMIGAVAGDSLAIGFCNAHYAYDFVSRHVKEGVMIVPVDFNENGRVDPKEQLYDSLICMQRAVYLGTFPSHLCRELTVVTQGVPTDKNVREFLRWIYDGGQAVAVQNGYPRLRLYIIRDGLALLGSPSQ